MEFHETLFQRITQLNVTLKGNELCYHFHVSEYPALAKQKHVTVLHYYYNIDKWEILMHFPRILPLMVENSGFLKSNSIMDQPP